MNLRALLRPASALFALAILFAAPAQLRAAEHITLRNGVEFDCARTEAAAGDRLRLYLLPSSSTAPADAASFIEVSAASVLRVDTVPDPPAPTPAPAPAPSSPSSNTPADIPQLLARAGALHHKIDPDLLASVVRAESNGNALAISRAGARGLMQLMPATAVILGVSDSFAPDQNISGGTAYLDQLLTRYHDDITLAVAAYNAGPAAVDRYHGIPPYPETRAYVARVVSEFNRRKRAALSAAHASLTASN